MAYDKKISSGGLLLAGLAAFAYYKYSRMSSDDKDKLVSDIKARGQKIVDEYVPDQFKHFFSAKSNNTSGTANANSHFGEGSAYSS
jgi:hypothetical protein